MPQSLRFNTSIELFEAFPEIEQDISARPTDQGVLDYVNFLVASETPEDAITFCAYLLAPREAVWWGHQCLHHIADVLPNNDVDLMHLAEAWVREPEEDQRTAALAAGMEARVTTPAAWLALAAGWSSGSMLPVGEPEVPAPGFLTARAVNAGVLSGLARVENDARNSTLRAFVDMATQLALGEE
jgi:hypothetical protein